MVLLSRPIDRPLQPQVFARWLAPGRQLLAVGLLLPADEDLAVVVPLALSRSSGSSAARLRDLSSVPSLFIELAGAFRPPDRVPKGASGNGRQVTNIATAALGQLEGTSVLGLDELRAAGGSFAGAVAAAEALPDAAELGFAAFTWRGKSPGRMARWLGLDARLWLMGVELDARDPTRLYFPTRFAAGGPPPAVIDHDDLLYCQVDRRHAPDFDRAQIREGDPIAQTGWAGARALSAELGLAAATAAIVDDAQDCFHAELYGPRPNVDRWVLVV